MSGKKKHNQIIAESCYGELLIDISTNKYPDTIMLIDTDDWDRLLKMDIGRISLNSEGYPRCFYKNRMIKIHRLINLNYSMIDHINHDKTDNRKMNLRTVSQQQNCMNRITRSTYKGISFHKRNKKFEARITINGQIIYIGSYENPIEAALAYDKKAIELFGDYACTNKSMGLI